MEKLETFTFPGTAPQEKAEDSHLLDFSATVMQKTPWRPLTAGCMTAATCAYRWPNTDGHRRTQDTVVVVVPDPDHATALVVVHVPVPAGAVHTHVQDLAQTDVSATNAGGQDLNVVTTNRKRSS